MKHYKQIKSLIEQDFDLETIKLLTDADENQIKLIAANIEIESNMQALGFERYMVRQEELEKQGKIMELDTTMTKMKMMLKPIARDIMKVVEDYKGRKPHIAVETFKKHDPYTLALITMRACMMAVTMDKTELAALTIRLVGAFEPDYTTAQKCRVGYKLIDILCSQSNGCFIRTKHSNGKHAIHVIEPTEELEKWEKENRELMATMSVMHRPIVVPPQPWTAFNKGGFWDDNLQRPFVRNNLKASNRTHGPKVMPRVYAAVNKIQATPFAVNNFVLDVANVLGDEALDYLEDVDRPEEAPDCFFEKFYQQLPERPFEGRIAPIRKRKEELEEQLGITKEERTKQGKGFGKWVRDLMERITNGPKYKLKQELEECRFKIIQFIKWRKSFTSKQSKNRVITTALGVANEYRDYSAIYFPANLDWRGRVYPMTAGLTTQGTGIQKALLKFASGKPIGTEEALYWLMVHTANCYGLDKESWQDRLEWTTANVDLIQRIGTAPLDNLEDWIHTDSPWLFIAACEQMNKYYMHGLDAVVDIPIPMDGTCNGAQHYAAMTRDTRGAFGVNVAPNGTQGLKERLKELRAKSDTVAFVPKEKFLTIATNRIMKALIGE